MRIKLPVTWHEDETPPHETIYLVAVRYPYGGGVYDIAKWDGKEWDLGYTGTVVGWAKGTEFLDIVDMDWPEKDKATDVALEREYLEYSKSRRISKN